MASNHVRAAGQTPMDGLVLGQLLQAKLRFIPKEQTGQREHLVSTPPSKWSVIIKTSDKRLFFFRK